MKYTLLFSTLPLFAAAQSLYEQRVAQGRAASDAYYEQLYAQRTTELTHRLEERMSALAAAYGGAKNFSFEGTPQVAAGSYFTGGTDFETANGGLACHADRVFIDLPTQCRGPALTRCPDPQLHIGCVDANRNFVALTGTSRARHRRGQ